MSELKHGNQILEHIPNTNYDFMNWNGFKVVVGIGRGPYIFNIIQERRNQNKANIFLIAGNPGEGKSYFALRMAEIFDKDFDVTIQVVFDRAQLLFLLGNDSPLKRGQVLMIDEAQFTAGNRSWWDEIQRELMSALEAIRSRGYIIMIVALHRNLLDLVIRQYVLNYMFWLESRGEATCYNIFTPRFESVAHQTRICTVKLQLPDFERCSHPDCLNCKYLYNKDLREGNCMTDRAIYERLKREAVGSYIKNAQNKAETKAMKEKGVSKETMLETLISHRNEITFTTQNKPDIVCIKAIILRELRKDLNTMAAYEMARMFSAKIKNETE